MKHSHAFGPADRIGAELSVGGDYQYRIKGEYHLINPATIA